MAPFQRGHALDQKRSQVARSTLWPFNLQLIVCCESITSWLAFISRRGDPDFYGI